MRKTITLILLMFAFSSVGQVKQQISLGYGLNNNYNNNNYPGPDLNIGAPSFVGVINYHHVFKSKFEVRGVFTFADYEVVNYDPVSGEFTYYNTKPVIINAGVMYHLYENKKLDLSTGFSLGLRYQEIQELLDFGKVKDLSMVSAVNLLNVKYFPFDEHFGIYGEVVIGLGYQANYFVGLVYQF